LVTRRAYKQPWTHDEACVEIMKLSGSQFDPKVVDALVHEMEAFKQIYTMHQD